MLGNRTRVKVIKNKVAPPFAEAEFDILFNHGINKEGNILDAALQLGVVMKRGAWLQFNGEMIGQGRDATVQEVTQNEALRNKLLEAIQVKQNEKNAEEENQSEEQKEG